jgi:integral membrane protein (TIGR01906 family)
MTFSARLRRLNSILITLLVPVVIVLGSARLLVTETYLRLEYAKPDFPPDPYGFTAADRLHYAPFAVNYLLNGEGIDYLRALTLPDGSPLYEERELRHMVDVQKVVQWAWAVLAGCAILCAALTGLLARSPDGRYALRRGLFGGGLLMLAILGALLIYMLLDWDRVFTTFHSLFFAQGSWQFYYTDSLIRLFPIRFWQDAALTVGGMSASGAILIMVFCRWWARRAAQLGARSVSRV